MNKTEIKRIIESAQLVADQVLPGSPLTPAMRWELALLLIKLRLEKEFLDLS